MSDADYHETLARLEDKTLAEQWFEYERDHAQMKERLEEVIEACLSAPVQDLGWTTDSYDNSIEIYGADPETFNYEPLGVAGFGVVWVHYGKMGPPGRCDNPMRRRISPTGVTAGCTCPGRRAPWT